MKILGCDLHAKQQTIAMVDTETGEFTEKTLSHEGNEVRAIYAALVGPVVVGIEATGGMQGFLELLEELGIECRVGHPAKIRAAETRKQKHDRRDGEGVLDFLVRKDRFPDIWTLDRTTGPANLITRATPMGEDASAIAAHVTGNRPQSRTARRPRALDRGGAENAAGFGPAPLHRSKTR